MAWWLPPQSHLVKRKSQLKQHFMLSCCLGSSSICEVTCPVNVGAADSILIAPHVGASGCWHHWPNDPAFLHFEVPSSQSLQSEPHQIDLIP